MSIVDGATFIYTYIYISICIWKLRSTHISFLHCGQTWRSSQRWRQYNVQQCEWLGFSVVQSCAKGESSRGATFDWVKCCASPLLSFHCEWVRDLDIFEEIDPSQSWRFDLESNVAPFPSLYAPLYTDEYLDRKTEVAPWNKFWGRNLWLGQRLRSISGNICIDLDFLLREIFESFHFAQIKYIHIYIINCVKLITWII